MWGLAVQFFFFDVLEWNSCLILIMDVESVKGSIASFKKQAKNKYAKLTGVAPSFYSLETGDGMQTHLN